MQQVFELKCHSHLTWITFQQQCPQKIWTTKLANGRLIWPSDHPADKLEKSLGAPFWSQNTGSLLLILPHNDTGTGQLVGIQGNSTRGLLKEKHSRQSSNGFVLNKRIEPKLRFQGPFLHYDSRSVLKARWERMLQKRPQEISGIVLCSLEPGTLKQDAIPTN